MRVGYEVVLRVPLQVIRDAQAKFADDQGPIAAAVVDAGLAEVGSGGFAGSGIVDAVVVGVFEVAVIVVGCELQVG